MANDDRRPRCVARLIVRIEARRKRLSRSGTPSRASRGINSPASSDQELMSQTIWTPAGSAWNGPKTKPEGHTR